MVQNKNSIYTDGSCILSKDKGITVGAWVSIILIGEEKLILKGTELHTTHQRMELTAVINSLKFILSLDIGDQLFTIYTDSQYVVQLQKRKDRLINQNFKSGKGTPIQNTDLVMKLLGLMKNDRFAFEKVKSHDNKNLLYNYNREADLLCRKMARKIFFEINTVI